MFEQMSSGQNPRHQRTFLKQLFNFKARTFPALVQSFGLRFFLGSSLKLVHDILVFVAPMLLKLIIQVRQRTF